ncbi:tyrosine-type recombinase/integrase [Alicyclobacillus acidocaldarius]|uniref:tyrosine-type recombinase/integrase n=1 Tax=Alicyclobacillus acidocaldarius TaxID=405212 RepID=UPI00345E1359
MPRGQFKARVRADATRQPVPIDSPTSRKEQIRMSWLAAVDWFLANARRAGHKPGSIETRRQRIQAFADWCIARNLPPAYVTPEDIQNFVDHCLNINLSVFTINGRLRVLKTFYSEGVAEGIFLSNPADGVRRLREPTNAVLPVSEDHVQKLLAVFDKRQWVEFRDLAITVLVLDTGLRIREALLAKVEDLDLREGALWVPPVHAKGGKGRTVYFGQATRELLSEWLRKRGVGSDLLFPSVYLDVSGAYHPLSRHAYWKRLAQYAERAGVPHIHPHQLRHTFAIQFLVRSGGDLVTLARQMGHSSTRTTERYLAVAETKAQKILTQQHSPIDHLGGAPGKRRPSVRRRIEE